MSAGFGVRGEKRRHRIEKWNHQHYKENHRAQLEPQTIHSVRPQTIRPVRSEERMGGREISNSQEVEIM